MEKQYIIWTIFLGTFGVEKQMEGDTDCLAIYIGWTNKMVVLVASKEGKISAPSKDKLK